MIQPHGYFPHPYSRELLELLLADMELEPLDQKSCATIC
jgi:hypothetical protein